MSLIETKKKEILRVLRLYNGNKTKAANHLGISLRGIRNITNQDPMFSQFKRDEWSEANQGKGNMNDRSQGEVKMTERLPQKQEQQVSEVFDTKEVVTTLNSLMKKVTETDCTPETVNAACNCASQITQLLRVHLDVERLKRKFA